MPEQTPPPPAEPPAESATPPLPEPPPIVFSISRVKESDASIDLSESRRDAGQDKNTEPQPKPQE